MKRINITIEDEIYLEIVRNGLIERQELSSTINKFLKLYLETTTTYDKTISELQEEISKLRLIHLNEITKETKKFRDNQTKFKNEKLKQKQISDSILNSGVLEDGI